MQEDQSAAEIGARVEARRRELGLSQEQLAVRAGTTRVTVNKIEKGLSKRPYRLGEVLRALGMLRGGDEEERIKASLIAAGVEPERAAAAAKFATQRLPSPRRPEDQP